MRVGNVNSNHGKLSPRPVSIGGNGGQGPAEMPGAG
jgi:hypothetical protein